jgi:hypothetical protein
MEVIEKNIIYKSHSTINPDIFHIYTLGDIHGGALGCAEDRIKREINIIKERENSFVIGMGDYLDCIVKDDKRFSSGGLAEWMRDKQDDIIETQRKWAVELFTPIKDKIICMLTGNHEETIHDKHQDNIGLHICDDLGVPYGGYQAFINLTFDREGSNESHRYIIHAWHGDGAAQTEGARLMRLMRLVNDVEAHVYLMGHLHAMTSHTPDRLVLRNGKIKSIELQATMTGSWLKGYTQPPKGKHLPPNYIEKKGYKPSRIGCPIIHFIPATDTITIES